MTLKAGDLIVIENTDNLKKSINEFSKKWATPAKTLLTTAMATEMATTTEMAVAAVRGQMAAPAATVTEKQTGKQVKLKYYGLNWFQFENKRLIGIVTEITKEEHPDLDVIKVREQTGGVRYCRRYILENV